MHIHTRRVIAFIFILIFLTCAPMLILYTAGYRYNLKKEELQKTGALVLATTPKGADIRLNNNRIEQTTPSRVNNLLPDNYLISLEKKYYYPWQKKLAVNAQETTFAEDIVLFEKSMPEKISVDKISWLNFSPQNKFALFAVNENLYLLNLNNPKQQDLLFSDKTNIQQVQAQWAKDGSMVLIQYNDQIAVVSNSILTRKKFDLTKLVAKNKLADFQWGVDNDALFARSGNNIYQINVSLNSLNKIYELPAGNALIDFFIYNDTIYLIERISKKFYLTDTKFDAATKPIDYLTKSIELNNGAETFDTVYGNYLGLENSTRNTYFLVNLELDKITFYKDNVQNLDLHEKNDYLLFATNQEVSYLDLKGEELKEKNITRYSQGVALVEWNKSPNYVAVLQNSKINIIELDERNGHWTLNLPYENITNFQFDAKSKNIFYLQDSYLWKLPIAQ